MIHFYVFGFCLVISSLISGIFLMVHESYYDESNVQGCRWIVPICLSALIGIFVLPIEQFLMNLFPGLLGIWLGRLSPGFLKGLFK